MDIEKIVGFLTRNGRDYLLTLAKVLRSLGPVFPLVEQPARNSGKPPDPKSTLSSKLIRFTMLSLMLGLAPLLLARPANGLGDFLGVTLVTVSLSAIFGALVHLLCRILGGGGSFVDVVSFCIQRFSAVFVVSSFLLLSWAGVTKVIEWADSFAQELPVREPLQIYFVAQMLLNGSYLIFGLPRLHGFRIVLPISLTMAVMVAVIFAVALNLTVAPPQPVPPAPAEFNELLLTQIWIAYEPVGYQQDPRPRIYPPAESIEEDLKVLAEQGFTGVITFESEDSWAEVPRLAREAGFRAVLMGISNPGDQEIVERAIEQSAFVDGYSVGHNKLGALVDGYSLQDVLAAMEDLRARTGKPVSTTEGLGSYETVAPYVNWLFPDWRSPWTDDTFTSDRALEFLRESVQQADALSRAHRKTALLKMISFPSAAGLEFNEPAQRAFFEGVFEYQCKAPDYPKRRVSLSYFAAFDIPWKSPQLGWDPQEQHTGILDAERNPKEATSVFKNPPALCFQ